MIGLLAALLMGSGWNGQPTCTPGSIDRVGAYRIYDNAWLEPTQCVRSNGRNSITIASNAIPAGGTVVAYPSIRFGAFYTDGDPQSGLPLPVTQLGNLTLHVASTGRTGRGAWQSDADMWLHPSVASIAHHHGTYELLVSNRYAWRHPGAGPDATLVRIGGVRYVWDRPWTTCQRTSNDTCDARIQPWRITIFFRQHPKAKARIYVPAFTWFLIHQHLMSRSLVLASVAYGTELWSGGRGLTDSLHVTGVGIPHLTPGSNR